MAQPTAGSTPISIADYLVAEETAQTPHEFHDGDVLPMSGGTYNHAAVATNLTAALSARLRGQPCRVRDSNLRVATVKTNRFVYPDASIHCDAPQFHPQDPKQTTLINPRAVFEVLSESTEGYDRGDKFNHYRRIPTLDEYVLLAQDRPLVESFLRQPDGTWSLTTWEGLDAVARIRCLPLDLALTELYDGLADPV